MWQMGGPGPMLGQVHHFVKYNPGKAPYAEERYLKEAQRLYKVLDTQLGKSDFVAGDYSIADIAIWPWISRFEWQTIDLNQFPNVKRWYTAVAARPAVQRGYKVPKDMGDIPMPKVGAGPYAPTKKAPARAGAFSVSRDRTQIRFTGRTRSDDQDAATRAPVAGTAAITVPAIRAEP